MIMVLAPHKNAADLKKADAAKQDSRTDADAAAPGPS
jgi:hypothetical protein